MPPLHRFQHQAGWRAPPRNRSAPVCVSGPGSRVDGGRFPTVRRRQVEGELVRRLAGDDDEQVGDMPVDDEALGARQPAVTDRGFDAFGVPPTARLGDGQRRKALARRNGWQEFFLLRRRRGLHDRGGTQHRRGKIGCAKQRSSHFLDDDGELRKGEALAAIGLRNVDRRQAEITRNPPPDFGVVTRFGLHQPAHFRRRRLVREEPPHGRTQLFLLVGE